ncbi:gamma-interferon-inducible lysosomal thiol reductase-like isoform X2 [Limulus polyphemus]|uniref:Gamma-interferon-inducible lysosomal thiol reductase-like isoform X2 n=1 Tax=Limulus polyphemus TaxID=6850 RepID=A0ABM1TPK2_LIMPO|nr:gamma-interferon-inducible lysosomal thiol reductase-like isoform X2 [Limulus polyphemus]
METWKTYLGVLAVLLQGPAEGVQRTQVSIYYSTLCTDSITFFSKQLWPTYTKIGSIMDVELVPFGKTKQKLPFDGTNSFECQFGPADCYGNIVQSCAVSLLNNSDLSVKFVACYFNDPYSPNRVLQCSQRFGINYNSIHQCATSKTGFQYFHQMGEKTRRLSPSLYFIPWVVINGGQMPAGCQT